MTLGEARAKAIADMRAMEDRRLVAAEADARAARAFWADLEA